MKFLKQAVLEAHGAKHDIIEALKKALSAPLVDRNHKEIHASDLTKDGFCPREIALMDLTGKSRKPQYVSVALQVTFDVGDITADLFREKWMAPEHTVGDWECIRCGDKRIFCKKPPVKEPAINCKHWWKYREVRFKDPIRKYSGGIDCILDLGAPKLTVIELKIKAPDDFNKINAPESEHRIRTNLYLNLIENSDHPMRHKINTAWAKVFYISRGFGKKHKNGEILPFKEFNVERNDADLKTPFAHAVAINLFREKGVIPCRTCEFTYTPRAKSCGMVVDCFSGKYPATPPLTSLGHVAIPTPSSHGATT